MKFWRTGIILGAILLALLSTLYVLLGKAQRVRDQEWESAQGVWRDLEPHAVPILADWHEEHFGGLGWDWRDHFEVDWEIAPDTDSKSLLRDARSIVVFVETQDASPFGYFCLTQSWSWFGQVTWFEMQGVDPELVARLKPVLEQAGRAKGLEIDVWVNSRPRY